MPDTTTERQLESAGPAHRPRFEPLRSCRSAGVRPMKVEDTMKALLRSALVLVFFLIANSPVLPCTVFFAFDGKVALAGSNEDWADPNTQVWFVPATKDNYGI